MKWLRFLAISVVLALDDDDEGEDIGGGWKKTVNDQGQRVQQMQAPSPAGSAAPAELLINVVEFEKR